MISAAPPPKDHARQLLAAGRLPEAKALFEQFCAENPDSESWDALGQIHAMRGDLSAAEHCFRQAITLCRDYAPGYCNLGVVLHRKGDLDGACVCYRTAHVLWPENPEPCYNLGQVFTAQGVTERAKLLYEETLVLDPRHPEARVALGAILERQGDLDGARACYVDAHINKGVARMKEGDYSRAQQCFREALALSPTNAVARSHLGNVLRNQGLVVDGIEMQREVLRFNPDSVEAYSRLLYWLNYHPELGAREIFEEHRRWGERHARTREDLGVFPAIVPLAGRRLRVGYVSDDLNHHAVAYFLEPILSHHNRRRVEVFCYSGLARAKHDAVTARIQALAEHWIDTDGIDDLALARRMREDGNDILVDLAGHTAHNHLRAFAYRPAPVQVSYLGYVSTTGLPAMDYRLTDAWADPAGSEALYTERLVHLPRAFFCYAPPPASPAVAQPPVLGVGYVTFGSFNHLAKITPRVIALWARLLRALPRARLLIMRDPFKDPATCARFYQAFETHGIAAERLILRAPVSFEDYLEAHNTVDIVLDTFPHAGHTVTCHALWMGVPVITLAGDRYVGRMGVSVLGNLGLSELIAQSETDYVIKAVRLAVDFDRLTVLRTGLRARFQESGLCDGVGFTRRLEEVYHSLWQRNNPNNGSTEMA